MMDPTEKELARLSAEVEGLAAQLAKLKQQIDQNTLNDHRTISRVDSLASAANRKGNATIGGLVGAALSCVIVWQLVVLGETKELAKLLPFLLGIPALTTTTGAFAKNKKEE